METVTIELTHYNAMRDQILAISKKQNFKILFGRIIIYSDNEVIALQIIEIATLKKIIETHTNKFTAYEKEQTEHLATIKDLQEKNKQLKSLIETLTEANERPFNEKTELLEMLSSKQSELNYHELKFAKMNIWQFMKWREKYRMDKGLNIKIKNAPSDEV